MSGLSESAMMKRIKEQCRPSKAVLHVNSNRRYQVVQEIAGVGVELKDLLEHELFVRWDEWANPEVWRIM